MKTKTLMIGMALLVGCATPKELVDARSTYNRVSAGPARQLNPAGLNDAKDALERAEAAHQREFRSGAYYTRDVSDTPALGYVAMRKAQIAEAEANAALAANEKARLSKELEQKMLAQQRARQESEAEMRRKAAEKEAADAAAKLSDIASVKQEERGTVLTLAGKVVFATGQAKLRPDSLEKLKRVAAALNDMPGGRMLVVEGHTDSVGSDPLNQRLSVNRAETVRNFLIQHGIKQSQIKAVGLGKTRPVADNETAEGRANNRRVEIIVAPNAG